MQLLARQARRTASVLVLIVAEGALLFPGALLRGESFFERDLLVDWYQRMAVLARCLHEGAWPLWDPSIGFGYPLLADPGAQILYPPAWAAFLLPIGGGYTAFVLLHLVIGGFGIARLARSLGCTGLASIAAACLWTASGPIQSTLNLRHHLAGSAWLPWVLVAVEGLCRAPRVRTVLFAAAIVAAQALAGSPDVCILTALLAAPWALLRLAERPRRLSRAVPALAGTAILAIGLSAAQWWPALDVVSISSRRDLPEDVRAFWSVPPAGLVRMALPLDPLRVRFEPATWTWLFDAPEPPFLHSIYLGTPALLLAAVALVARRRRGVAVALAALAAAAVACALGPHAPVYGVLMDIVPALRILRYPSKALLVVAPLVALLAALGIDAVERSWAERRPAAVAVAAVAALAATAAAVGARYAATPAWIASPFLFAAAAAALLLAVHRRLRARAAAAAISALCALDLLAAHADLNATTRLDALTPPPPAAALARNDEHRRLYVYDYTTVRGVSERLLGRANPLWTADPPAGVDRRVFEAFSRTLYMPGGLAGLFGLENSYDFDLRGLSPFHLNDLTFFLRRLEGTPVHVRILRMGAVETVLSLHRAGFEGLWLERSLPSLFPEPILLWRVPETLPRAWLAGCSFTADGGDALRRLADPAFDPAAEVILPERRGSPESEACGAAGSTRITVLHADRVRIEVNVQHQGGYLVLADAWEPGWRATVDGGPAAGLRANVAFRAVAVPAGRHVVEMVYRPRAAWLGLVTSIGSLAAISLVVIARRRRHR